MSNNDIYESYRQWLYMFVGGAVHQGKHYYLLYRTLYDMDFYWTILYDHNRAEDGKDLRSKFVYDTDADIGYIDETFLYRPCNVLEMLIALAYRWDNEIIWDPKIGKQIDILFWTMLYNLNLEDCSDEEWSDRKELKIHHTIETLLDRQYAPDGSKGGLFPLRYPKDDQRNVEIWYQLAEWIIEHYDI